jgi:hypothetical protein
MATQPTFMSDGAKPNPQSTKWEVWAKICGALVNQGLGTSADIPLRTDTLYQLKQKVNRLKAGL